MEKKSMKKKRFVFDSDSFFAFLLIVGMVLFVAFILINIFWVIYAFVKYGGQPIDEVPTWALFYMFGRR